MQARVPATDSVLCVCGRGGCQPLAIWLHHEGRPSRAQRGALEDRHPQAGPAGVEGEAGGLDARLCLASSPQAPLSPSLPGSEDGFGRSQAPGPAANHGHIHLQS